MNEQHNEALSALFDGETSEFETRRLLDEITDEDLETWHHYQMISQASQHKLEPSALTFSVVDAVAEAIADEATPVAQSSPQQPNQTSWIKPFVGFAAAASVAFVAVLGVQDPDIVNQGFVADGNVAVSQLPISGELGVSAVSGTAAGATFDKDVQAIEAQKMKDAERLQHYLQQHTQHAAFNNGRGLMPMARMNTGE